MADDLPWRSPRRERISREPQSTLRRDPGAIHENVADEIVSQATETRWRTELSSERHAYLPTSQRSGPILLSLSTGLLTRLALWSFLSQRNFCAIHYIH